MPPVFMRMKSPFGARKLYSVLEEEKISLGLSLIADLKLMMLGGWNNDGAVIPKFMFVKT